MTRIRRSAAALALAAALLSLAGPPHRAAALVRDAAANTISIAAAGDIACDPTDPAFNSGVGTPTSCHMKQTSDLLVGRKLAAVLPLGDIQYTCASLSDFQQSFDRSWGRVKKLMRPTPGNHEYIPYPDWSGRNDCPQGGAGYFDYFGAAAGDRNKGYYSYNLGRWHLIALNSECFAVGGCQTNSPQERWLRADLARHRKLCTLAYWHEPYLTSAGTTHLYEQFRPLWQDLMRGGVEIVLTGHHHNYERFAPQDADMHLDPRKGIREFVVGTGGSTHSSIAGRLPTSRVRNDQTFGVLVLRLAPTRYSWRFVPESGASFTDTGSSACHR